MKDMECLRCGKQMIFIKRESLQLGRTGWLLGDFSNLLAGALEVNIYMCEGCGKIEFYSDEPIEEELMQKECPNCGKMHDFDYPKCPFCKYDYFE